MAFEQEPFLRGGHRQKVQPDKIEDETDLDFTDEESEIVQAPSVSNAHRIQVYRWIIRLIFGVNVAFLLLAVANVFWVRSYCPDEPDSMTKGAIKYTAQLPNLSSKKQLSLGRGKTRALLDALGETFRAPRDDLEKNDIWQEDNIALEHGGYMASFGIMHELHCLAWMQDSYKTNVTSILEATEHEIEHLDHCLLSLAKSAECAPNLDIDAYFWHFDGDIHPVKPARNPRMCVNWGSVMKWLEPRRIKYTDGVVEGAVSPVGLARHGIGLALGKNG